MSNASDSESKVTLCDPCQIKERGDVTVCGWQGPSLQPHLKKHKKSKNGPSWSIADYKKRFPKFSVGGPAYSPPEEQIKKFREANPLAKAAAATPRQDVEQTDEEAERELNARFEELWSMCERDPAAKVIAMAAAKDEIILKEAYRRLEEINKSKKYDDLKYVNQTLEATHERLDRSYKSLSLTVDQRRKSNQLGSDTVSQLVCNFANTWRKMSPDKQEAFRRRVATVFSVINERVKIKHLDAITLPDDHKAEQIVNDDDYRARIASFRPTDH